MHKQVGQRDRRNGSWKLVGLTLLTLVGLSATQGCSGASATEEGAGARPRVVEAERFVVRAPDGKERAVLGLLDGGRLYLSLYDARGKQRAAVGVEEDGPSVKLFNSEGKLQAVLDLLGEQPRLTLFDGEGHIRHKVP